MREACNIEKDKKYPETWNKNKNFFCRTADRGKGKVSFKDVLLQVCTIVIEFGFVWGALFRYKINQ